MRAPILNEVDMSYCPKCKAKNCWKILDGDYSCVFCGFVVYKVPPLPYRAGMVRSFMYLNKEG